MYASGGKTHVYEHVYGPMRLCTYVLIWPHPLGNRIPKHHVGTTSSN